MNLIVVDDDPDTRALVVRALAQEFPHSAIREASDMAGLDRILAEARPDLLVTDFDLRWTDGLAIFDRVKAADPDCCTIMFTGTGNEELAVRAMKQGFDDYIVKEARQLKRLAASARVAYERRRDRRGLEENRNLVLKELYHRLHNNLQIVISLIHMTARAMPDAASRGQIADLSRRIQALSALQEQFFRSPDFRRVDFGAFLEELGAGLVGISGGRVALETAIDNLVVPVDTAVPLALIANEILTNALTHGFPKERRGSLDLRLERDGGRVVLTIANDGVTFDPAPASDGFGMSLVRRLASQIDATVDLTGQGGASVFRITMPLDRSREEPGSSP
jgi:two-component sensor histidine kinase